MPLPGSARTVCQPQQQVNTHRKSSAFISSFNFPLFLLFSRLRPLTRKCAQPGKLWSVQEGCNCCKPCCYGWGPRARHGCQGKITTTAADKIQHMCLKRLRKSPSINPPWQPFQNTLADTGHSGHLFLPRWRQGGIRGPGEASVTS